MAQRLMTPFCLASRLAAALIAEGAIAGVGARAAAARKAGGKAPAGPGAVEARVRQAVVALTGVAEGSSAP